MDLRPDEHPRSEQVIDEHRAVAIWTSPARSQGHAKKVAGFAAADADEPLVLSIPVAFVSLTLAEDCWIVIVIGLWLVRHHFRRVAGGGIAF